jgi:SAM-dependent methyltransferase
MSLVGLRELLSECIPRDHCRQTNSEQLLRNYVLARSAPINVLDFGCGNGRSIDLFKEILPDSKWTGVDIESSPEVNSRERTDEFFFTYDGRTLPFPSDSFDLVYSNQVMEHVRDPEFSLQEIRRVLCRGGTFIGQTSQFEPYHSYSLWNFTIFGWKCIVEDAGLILRELRPAIDGFTLMERAYLRRPREYNSYFSNESPKNKEIEEGANSEGKSAATINYRKLLWCGQFSFICEKG